MGSFGAYRLLASSSELLVLTRTLQQYSFIDVLNKKAQTFFAITKLKSTMLQVA